MNTTVQALQALYVKLGGSLTDTYDNIADGATVADYATIPDMVDAIAQISNTFIVTYTADEHADISCDKTASEIYAAYESGKTITAQLEDRGMAVVMHLFSIASISGQNVISFSALDESEHQFMGVGVLHVGDDNGNDQITISNIRLANEQDVRNAEDCIVGYDYAAGNILTQNNDLLKMFTALQGTNTIRAVVMGMQETDGDNYFTLQSYSYVDDNDPESGDITSVTHTIIFASFTPAVAGAKMRFITQTVVTNAPTNEAFDIVSQSATYEEKDIPITP